MTDAHDPLAAYDYAFPPELVAQQPADPRDSARLLVYDRSTGTISLDTFSHIDAYLPPRSVVVFNQTKVLPARMRVQTERGTEIDLLYLEHDAATLHVLAPRTLRADMRVSWAGATLTVIARAGKEAVLQPSFATSETLHLLERHGRTPLPPYISAAHMSEEERRREYQTTFAHHPGSVAAPTAGLHFTPALIERLRDAGHAVAYVTLHVGLGTFAPLTEEQLRTRTLHEEQYSIDTATAHLLTQARREGRPIVAVGTTTVRAIESATTDDGLVLPGDGRTTLFLSPDNPPRTVTAMVTNFHVPRSSLLLLVASIVGRDRLLALYERAIRERMRLFSFGDGMLIR